MNFAETIPNIEVSILVSTYNRPSNLKLCLKSLELQKDVNVSMEVVVADDGSRDQTKSVVSDFSKRVSYPVTFTTHAHDGFRLARTRNESVISSRGRYLIFLDGDVIVPPNFVKAHLDHRLPNTVMAGDTCWLERDKSNQLTTSSIEKGSFHTLASNVEKNRLRGKSIRAAMYCFLRLPNLPRLKGSNIAIWKDDFLQINGYDEDFVGWGLEDTNLQHRLSKAGVRFKSSMFWTRTYHVWHQRDPSYVKKARGTQNDKMLKQKDRPMWCINGIDQKHCFEVTHWNRELGFEEEPEEKKLNLHSLECHENQETYLTI